MATISPAEEQAQAKLALLRRRFQEAFTGERDQSQRASFVFASAPGRMEIAGNHVDHQGGRVISGAIDERTWGLAAENGLNRIRVVMDGFGTDVLELDDSSWLEPHPVERESSAALVRGMVAAFVRAGGTVRGFDAVTTSDVPPGCGLSSSAAFEVMMGALVEGLF
ncbi:MAG: galactokinase family protein, partial [Adlercreutzia sp.]|nr:galactokinase family protein [Adlercreutzia sp.]